MRPRGEFTTTRKVAVAVAGAGAISAATGAMLWASAQAKRNDACGLCSSLKAACQRADQANALRLASNTQVLETNIALGIAAAAYRSATAVAYTNYARFDLPAAWRTQAPFGYPGNDLTTGVSINGSALTTATVRYGRAGFASMCSDSWSSVPGDDWGRICVDGTTAPFFNTFMLAGTDHCSDSSQPYYMTPCTHDKRFSIAVR